MPRTELLLSVWESALNKEEKFWAKLGKLITAKRLTSVGISTLSPYGLSYGSVKLPQFVHMEDFVDSSIHNIDTLAKDSDVHVDFWLSILYNVFLSDDYRQVDNEGKPNPDFICPNRHGILRVLKDVFADIFTQRWFNLSYLTEKPGIILDAIRFFDFEHCCCDSCIEAFEKESGIYRTSFREFMKENHRHAKPLFSRKWVMFRSKSITRFLREALLSVSNVGETSTVYSGFGDESSLSSGPVQRGCLFEDFVHVDVDRIVIRCTERWLYKSDARDEVLFLLPIWRDTILETGKQVALIVYGYHMQNEIASAEKLVKETGIDALLFAPMSSYGAEEIVRYYLSK